jgi:hypothetical protein
MVNTAKLLTYVTITWFQMLKAVYVYYSYYDPTQRHARSPKFYSRGIQPTQQHNFYKSIT